MDWTKILPKKEGYYGFKDENNDAKIVYIIFADGIEYIYFTGNPMSFNFNDFINVEFYGPIKLP